MNKTIKIEIKVSEFNVSTFQFYQYRNKLQTKSICFYEVKAKLNHISYDGIFKVFINT